MLPEIPQLEAFVAVAEARHFGRAAAALHVTQSTVSHRIAALERTLDLRLFDRGRGPITLTPAGAAYLRRTQTTLRELRQAEADARDAAAGQRERIVVGYSGALSCAGVLDAVAATIEALPEVTLEFRRHATHEQFPALERGEIDLAATFRAAAPPDGLAAAELSPRPLHAWVAAGSRLADRGTVGVDDLDDERLVWLSEFAERGFARHVDERLGAPRRPPIEVDALDAAFDLVSRGVAVLVCPDTPIAPRDVVRLDLAPARQATIVVVRRPQHSPGLDRLWAELTGEPVTSPGR